jgi:hypothetical protein
MTALVQSAQGEDAALLERVLLLLVLAVNGGVAMQSTSPIVYENLRSQF